MGIGYRCTCNKCGYSFEASLGGGFQFPTVYKETVSSMKKGKYGLQGKVFFLENPYGAIDCDTVVVHCPECGKYDMTTNKTMYVPKKKYKSLLVEPKGRIRTFLLCKNSGYVSKMDLDFYYDIYEKYNHKCSFCGGNAEMIEDFDKKLQDGELGCPECDGVFESTSIIMWD